MSPNGGGTVLVPQWAGHVKKVYIEVAVAVTGTH